ncbi:MAG: hypothetical protein A2X64_10855 [Ignavibacteria bacterium GWF2_33_9]|nr:MAG: hypothetical protein A2X64_10855 [Ignavibacteria bacterium GWF2_33_9]
MKPFVTNRYVYGPYGEPQHYDNEKERQGFIGKERDLESGLADHGVRKYDYISGRFTSVDPLSEKFYGWSSYQYSFNNPITFLDGNGLLPGDLFSTPEIAAHDFGKNYNPISVIKDREISSWIFEVKDGNKNYYTYSIPAIGNTHNVNPYSSNYPAGKFDVFFVHTHGAESGPDYDDENFSDKGGDLDFLKNNNFKKGFLITPSGLLKASDNKENSINSNQPPDPRVYENKSTLYNKEKRDIPLKCNGKTFYIEQNSIIREYEKYEK